MPWRRNIPNRGMSYIHMLVAGFVAYWLERTVTSRRVQYEQESFWEGQNIDMACMPLYEVEIDRDELRCFDRLFQFLAYFFLQNP